MANAATGAIHLCIFVALILVIIVQIALTGIGIGHVRTAEHGVVLVLVAAGGWGLFGHADFDPGACARGSFGWLAH